MVCIGQRGGDRGAPGGWESPRGPPYSVGRRRQERQLLPHQPKKGQQVSGQHPPPAPPPTLLLRTGCCSSLKLYRPEGCDGSQACLEWVGRHPLQGRYASLQGPASAVLGSQGGRCSSPALSCFPCRGIPGLSPALGWGASGGDYLEKAPPTPYMCLICWGWGSRVIYLFYSLSNSQK